MKRHLAVALALLVSVSASPRADQPDEGQLGQIGGAVRRVQQVRELQVSESEEVQLGAAVSERMRARYGVVQDRNVHKYVALVGGVLAQASPRPNLTWHWIVLDTDAVNAFAAPGGYVHITRGALGLLESEAELAGVLGHEIIHITEKHSIRSMQKSKTIQMGADETLSGNAALLNRVAESVYLDLIDKGFGRAEEHESDEKGMTIANGLGYAPQGIVAFLTRLQERNKGATTKRGLFASHPETKDRIDRLNRQIQTAKMSSTATGAERYRKNIPYKPIAQSAIATVEDGASGLAGGDEKPAAKEDPKKEEPKKRGFGLGRLLPAGGGEQKTAQASASGGTRGVDPERDARGGTNPTPVVVTLTAADYAAFKKEGGLK